MRVPLWLVKKHLEGQAIKSAKYAQNYIIFYIFIYLLLIIINDDWLEQINSSKNW